ncbi:MAG TPA: glycosyltransferase family 2 protein [Acidimicrobiales bacterium]
MNTRPLVSVVCPVFNEEDVVEAFVDRATAALDAIADAADYELLFVDDGSSDGSGDLLRKFADRHPKVRLIELSRNFGHQLAITAGIDEAAGDAVVVIDTDLQDPPEVIPEMVALWREGRYKVIYGQRAQRKGESGFKLVTARVFYRLLNRLSDVDLPVDAGDFRLMDRAVVDVLKGMRETNRYMRGMVAWVGYPQTAIEYDRDSRYAGRTKYTLWKMLRFALDGITSFSEKPLRIATQTGLLVTLASALFAIYTVFRKIYAPSFALPGWASLMTAALFLGGVQLLSIGVLGEYVARIFRETKGRPLYVIADRVSGRDEARERDDEGEAGERAG